MLATIILVAAILIGGLTTGTRAASGSSREPNLGTEVPADCPELSRKFQLVPLAEVKVNCPAANAASAKKFLVENASTVNQASTHERCRLVKRLQQEMERQNLMFNVAATRNNSLELTLPSGARRRLCPPTFQLSYADIRVPRYMVTVSCSPGCKPVTRKVQVFEQFCKRDSSVYYSEALAEIGIDCELQ